MDIDFVLTGQRIKAARKLRGLTADNLAEKVGLATESYRHIENASSKPSLSTLFRIATELEVSLDYLTGRTTDLGVSSTGTTLSSKQNQMVQELMDNIAPIVTKYI